MAEQYVPNLGELAGDAARRDAVHIAVAPVVAAGPLRAGDPVGIDEHSQRAFYAVDGRGHAAPRAVGVVDPFLKINVMPGERFWLFLYPNTVTSLRHVWTHPAFAPKVPAKEDVNP